MGVEALLAVRLAEALLADFMAGPKLK